MLSLKQLNLWLLFFSCSVVFNSLWPRGSQHRLPCPSLSPRVCSNSCPVSWWCYPTISSSVARFSPCLQSFPASGSFSMSGLFTSGGKGFGASDSTSALLMRIQYWFPLGWTGLISLLFKGLSRVFSSTTVWKHQFFGTQPSLWSNIHTWLRDRTIALTIWAFVGKVISLLFNMLYRVVKVFLPRSKLQSPSIVLLEPQETSLSLFPFLPHLFAMKW